MEVAMRDFGQRLSLDGTAAPTSCYSADSQQGPDLDGR